MKQLPYCYIIIPAQTDTTIQPYTFAESKNRFFPNLFHWDDFFAMPPIFAKNP